MYRALPGVKRPTAQQNTNRVARPRTFKNMIYDLNPEQQASYERIWHQAKEQELAPYPKYKHKKILEDQEIVAEALEKFDSIVDSETQIEPGSTFSLKHSKWKLHCADYWKYFDPAMSIDVTFLPSNVSAQAEGSDLVVNPFPNAEAPSDPDEVPVYGAMMALLQIDTFGLVDFAVPKGLDPLAGYSIKTVASGSGQSYQTRIQFFSDDYLKLSVSKALLSHKFPLSRSAPGKFEFISIRTKPEVKYDASQAFRRAQETAAANGYIIDLSDLNLKKMRRTIPLKISTAVASSDKYDNHR